VTRTLICSVLAAIVIWPMSAAHAAAPSATPRLSGGGALRPALTVGRFSIGPPQATATDGKQAEPAQTFHAAPSERFALSAGLYTPGSALVAGAPCTVDNYFRNGFE
jgi:hypothetical protein